MSDAPQTLAPFYDGWDRYQSLLVESVAPLTAEQLDLHAADALRSIGKLVAHVIATRARWFHRVLGEGGPEFEALVAWDEPDAPRRSAGELVAGLETTQAPTQGCLHHWTPAMLDDQFTRPRRPTQTASRQWVIWHVIEHDLHHGGEIFFTLGMHGLPTPDI